MDMDLQSFATITGIVGGIGTLVSWYVKTIVEKAADQTQLKVAEWRTSDKEQIMAWINGSFMRSKEAHARMEGMEHALERIEDKLDRPTR